MPYPDQDLFGTVDEALDKAKVLGCYIDNDSYHEESLDNETFFMPCATHEEYEEVSNEDRAVDLSVPKYIQENAKVNLVPRQWEDEDTGNLVAYEIKPR